MMIDVLTDTSGSSLIGLLLTLEILKLNITI